MRRETDKHGGAPPPDVRSEDRLAGTDPLSADTDDPRSSPGLVVPRADSDRLTTKAFKLVGKEAAAGLIRWAAVGLIVLIFWLAFGTPSRGEVLHAVRPYWDEFAIALAGFLVGVVVCLPRLLVARRVVKRSATQEQAALEQAALASDLEQQEFYRSALREAFPDKTIDWLRGDAPPTTWLREETLGLERIVTGKSALSVSWDEPHPETLRRGLVDGIIDLWAALGPPSPSPEYPQVMVATTSRTDCLGRARSVLDAYQLLATTLNPARRLSSQRCQSERNPR